MTFRTCYILSPFHRKSLFVHQRWNGHATLALVPHCPNLARGELGYAAPSARRSGGRVRAVLLPGYVLFLFYGIIIVIR